MRGNGEAPCASCPCPVKARATWQSGPTSLILRGVACSRCQVDMVKRSGQFLTQILEHPPDFSDILCQAKRQYELDAGLLTCQVFSEDDAHVA